MFTFKCVEMIAFIAIHVLLYNLCSLTRDVKCLKMLNSVAFLMGSLKLSSVNIHNSPPPWIWNYSLFIKIWFSACSKKMIPRSDYEIRDISSHVKDADGLRNSKKKPWKPADTDKEPYVIYRVNDDTNSIIGKVLVTEASNIESITCCSMSILKRL